MTLKCASKTQVKKNIKEFLDEMVFSFMDCGMTANVAMKEVKKIVRGWRA